MSVDFGVDFDGDQIDGKFEQDSDVDWTSDKRVDHKALVAKQPETVSKSSPREFRQPSQLLTWQRKECRRVRQLRSLSRFLRTDCSPRSCRAVADRKLTPTRAAFSAN